MERKIHTKWNVLFAVHALFETSEGKWREETIQMMTSFEMRSLLIHFVQTELTGCRQPVAQFYKMEIYFYRWKGEKNTMANSIRLNQW